MALLDSFCQNYGKAQMSTRTLSKSKLSPLDNAQPAYGWKFIGWSSAWIQRRLNRALMSASHNRRKNTASPKPARVVQISLAVTLEAIGR